MDYKITEFELMDISIVSHPLKGCEFQTSLVPDNEDIINNYNRAMQILEGNIDVRK